jgi:hypothetical protein
MPSRSGPAPAPPIGPTHSTSRPGTSATPQAHDVEAELAETVAALEAAEAAREDAEAELDRRDQLDNNRLTRIENKLDALDRSVGQLSAKISILIRKLP